MWSKKTNNSVGLLLVIISGIVFGAVPSGVTYCYAQGATAALVILGRYSILSAVMLPMALRKGNLWSNGWKNLKKLLVLSIAGTSTPFLLCASYNYIPTGIATSLHFLHPIVVALICMFAFKDKVSNEKIVCFGLCLAGVLLMSGDMHQSLNRIGIVIALLSSITWGTYITLLDKLKITGLTSEQVIFFVGLFSMVLTALFGLLSGKIAVQVTPNGWMALAAVNILAAICGSAFFAIGIRRTDAQTAAIASTLEPITSVIIGVLFLDEMLSVRSFVSIAMILMAIIILTRFETKTD